MASRIKEIEELLKNKKEELEHYKQVNEDGKYVLNVLEKSLKKITNENEKKAIETSIDSIKGSIEYGAKGLEKSNKRCACLEKAFEQINKNHEELDQLIVDFAIGIGLLPLDEEIEEWNNSSEQIKK